MDRMERDTRCLTKPGSTTSRGGGSHDWDADTLIMLADPHKSKGERQVFDPLTRLSTDARRQSFLESSLV